MGAFMNYQGYTIKDFEYWKILLGLGFASFFIFAAIYCLQPLLPLFTKSFQISVTYASLSVSLSILGLIIGLMITGFLSDRTGRLFFIHLSISLTALILILIPFLPSFSFIIVFR